jgi:hypothetical protein
MVQSSVANKAYEPSVTNKSTRVATCSESHCSIIKNSTMVWKKITSSTTNKEQGSKG